MFSAITGPVSPPADVTADVLSPISIHVTWEEVPPFDQNGVIIAYEVSYEPLNTFDGQLEVASMNSTDMFIILSGLQEFLGYNITVRAYTVAGPGPSSDVVANMTSEDGNTACIGGIPSDNDSVLIISSTWKLPREC